MLPENPKTAVKPVEVLSLALGEEYVDKLLVVECDGCGTRNLLALFVGHTFAPEPCRLCAGHITVKSTKL